MKNSVFPRYGKGNEKSIEKAGNGMIFTRLIKLEDVSWWFQKKAYDKRLKMSYLLSNSFSWTIMQIYDVAQMVIHYIWEKEYIDMEKSNNEVNKLIEIGIKSFSRKFPKINYLKLNAC